MPSGGRGSFQRSFRPELDAAIRARRTLEEDLRDQVDDDLLERSRLVVTEVITNCIQHAELRPAQLIDMHVWVVPEMVRIEITDQGPGFGPVAARRAPDKLAAGGWGLWLVDQLTDRWGVDFSHSSRVWLEFDRDSG